MKALFYSEHGSVDVLRYDSRPDPTIGSADVLIQVAATAINRLDIVQRNGWFTLPGFALPQIAGMDMAGTVVELGSAVSGINVGDRVVVDPSLHAVAAQSSFAGHGDRHGELGVLGATHPGGYGALCAVSADHVHLMPADLSFVAAAVFPTAWMTTHHALFRVGKLQAGETLLLHGATSALTLAATQLAIAADAEVLVTAATEEKCARGVPWVPAPQRQIGMPMSRTGLCNKPMVRASTWCSTMWDPALWETSLFALAPQGRLVTCGNTTGDSVSIPSLGFLFQRGAQIKGSDAYFSTDFAEVWSRYCQGISKSQFSPQIHRQYPIENGAIAQQELESGNALGRIVLLHDC